MIEGSTAAFSLRFASRYSFAVRRRRCSGSASRRKRLEREP